MSDLIVKYDLTTDKTMLFDRNGSHVASYGGVTLNKDVSGDYYPHNNVYVGENKVPVMSADGTYDLDNNLKLNDEAVQQINDQARRQKQIAEKKAIENKSQFASQFTAPSNANISQLVNNGTQVYGSEIKNLVWPVDLLSLENNPYGGSYTVFFISEHQDASISKVKTNAAEFTLNARGGSIAETMKTSSADSRRAAEATINASMGYLLGKSAGVLLEKTPGINAVSSVLSKIAKKSVGSASDVARTTLETLGGGAVAYSVGFGEAKTQYTTLKVCIALPTPSITQTNSISWKETDSGSSALSSIHHWIARSSGNASNTNTTNPSAFSNTNSGFWETMGEALTSTALASTDVVQGGFMSRLMGKAQNPRKEQMFEDVEFRSYDFKYEMFARSKEEMDSIESIIKVLKYHAHPELTSSTFLYIYPAQFDIVHYFKDKPNPHMPRHATSILKNIDVEYGNDGILSFHNDGSPVRITLTLKFDEIAVLAKHDILQGF